MADEELKILQNELTLLLIEYVNVNAIYTSRNALIEMCHRRRNHYRRQAKQQLKQALTMISATRSHSGRIWSQLRQQVWFDDIVPQMCDEEWKSNFRVDRTTFDFICTRVSKDMMRQRTVMRDCIPLQKRVAIALYFLASTVEYRTISNLFGVGRSTVCNIVSEFCDSIVRRMLFEYVSFCSDKERAEHLINSFWNDWGFPQCIGAIDGCHIPVTPPREHAADYYNYMGWYSIVLLAVVDHEHKFTYINVGSPGRNNDAHIFTNSILMSQISQDFLNEMKQTMNNVNVPPCLVGDSAFPLLPNLMKPYPKSEAMTDVQRNFNCILRRASKVSENAFGRLKGRFRCLANRIKLDIDNVPVIVQAACILHNLCEILEDDFERAWELVQDQGPQTRCSIGANDSESRQIRNAIAEALYNKNLG